MLFQRSAVLLMTTTSLASAAFTDVTEDVLPPYTQTSVPMLDITKTPMPAGVCTLDANNDGSPDLYFVSGQGSRNALMINNGEGIFDDVAMSWGLVQETNSAVSCLAVDLDNDGCDDLVLTGAYTGGDFTGNLLLKNNYCSSNGKDATFSDVTPDLLRNWPYTVSSSATDFDNDGLLDLYVSSLPALDLSVFPAPAPLSSFPGSSLLLHNTGNFTFDDISPTSGANNATCPCMTVLMDYDLDGYDDIIAINCGNDVIQAFDMQLYRNNGDLTFEDVTNQTGFSGPDAEQGMWMGAGVGDFDHDGCLDFVSSNLASNPVYHYAQPQIVKGQCHGDGKNNKKPGFVMEDLDIEPIPGRDDLTLFAWGPIARDFNNDGELDFYWSGNYLVLFHPNFQYAIALTQGLLPPMNDTMTAEDMMAEADVAVNKNGENRFLQEMDIPPLTPGEIFYGLGEDADHEFRLELAPVDLSGDYNIIMTSGDYNGDGALDIVVAVDGSIPGPRGGRPLIMYGQPNGNNWLGVRLVGTGPNTSRQAIGAVAHLNKMDGTAPTQTLILSAGSAAMSTEEKTLFFGIGSEDVSDYVVTITWPGGEKEVFDGFKEPEIVTLVQGEGRAYQQMMVEAKKNGCELAYQFLCDVVNMFQGEENPAEDP